jgi:hypothetical protein
MAEFSLARKEVRNYLKTSTKASGLSHSLLASLEYLTPSLTTLASDNLGLAFPQNFKDGKIA